MTTDGLHQVNPPSVVVLNERKYPVVFNEPSFSQVFGNFRWEEYKLIASSIAVGAPLGYYLGWRHHMSRPSMWMVTVMFGTAALAHGVQASTARLMGILPNDREVKDYLEPKSGKARD